jgi:hypothetical protein
VVDADSDQAENDQQHGPDREDGARVTKQQRLVVPRRDSRRPPSSPADPPCHGW